MGRLSDVCDLINSIQKQTYENIETVLVAEKSKDLFNHLKSFVQKNGFSNITIVFNSGIEGLSAARNVGIKLATGEILAFVDDDVSIPTTYVEEVVRTYSLGDAVIGVTGLISPNWVDGALDFFPEEFDWIFSCSHWFPVKEIVEMRNVFGANFSFRREAFQTSGLFDTKYGFPYGSFEGNLGEDNEISIRVKHKTGKRIFYNPNVEVYHKVHTYRFQWRFILKRSYNMGKSRRLMKQYYFKNEDPLNVERSLLKRQMISLPIKILNAFAKNPFRGAKMFCVSTMVSSFTALGYIIGPKR
jgi:glycosyltransferase involved in cell wall biosynthesis